MTYDFFILNEKKGYFNCGIGENAPEFKVRSWAGNKEDFSTDDETS
jgi:hypothetical protein